MKAQLAKVQRGVGNALSSVAIIFPRSLKPTNPKEAHELHPTAYLDALRGYAAWVVYNGHTMHDDWRSAHRYFMHFAVFKLPYVGHAMVDLFFVISGFALSYQVLGLMHTQPSKVMDSLASSIVRRHVRLYLPTAFATFVAMVCFSTGLAVKTEEPNVVQPTALGNLWFWIRDTVRASDPFPHVVTWWYGGIFGSYYLPQMWTIPIEFRGSMTLFLICAAVAKMNVRKRMFVTLTCSALCFWWQTAYMGLFLAGMWLADRRQLQNVLERAQSATLPTSKTDQDDAQLNGDLDDKEAQISPLTPSETPSPRASWHDWANFLRNGGKIPPTLPIESSLLRQLPYFLLAYVALVFMAAPLLIDTNSPFPYNLAAWVMPPTYEQGAQIHWPLSIGAIGLCYALENSPLLRRPLMTPFSQFVGELSFGIYAMHNTVRWLVWEQYFVPWQGKVFGGDNRDVWYFLPGYFVMTFLVVWAAEMFRRVDVKCVYVARRMKEMLFAD
ncbi:Putative acyltransferase 3 domain-containing protein [Septoria linicola]|uniref:Acyltransferase 3 domain-containing protein n=1 Tax=Septoria linicola TaxID=215465 RepID=A0A9Q9AYG1_9PEZI|nr:Putative acyltransferase 3 domain-containing protein [Septoria linicola]